MRWYKPMSIKWQDLKLVAARNPKLVWGSLLGLGGVVYVKVWLPITNISIPCLFHEVTGLYCPGCGITRAALAWLQLDAHQAIRYNLLIALLVPLYALYHVANRKRMRRTSSVLLSVMLTATLLFGILRNLPAFDWLAPTELGGS